jgi:hypothetical protein
MAAPDRSRPAETSPGGASRPATTSPQQAVSSAVVAAAKEGVKAAILEKRPYLKFAFANPYNVSLFLGTLAAAGITLNPFLALLAIGLEGLWLLHAPDSKRLRHILWDPKFEKLREALVEQERAERVKVLSDAERSRVGSLIARQKEIRRLAARNPSFTGELLRGELVKTDRLVEAFLDMAVTSARYQEYLDSIDLDALDRDRARWDRDIRTGKEGDPQVDLAKKNLAIILRRLEKVKEIRRYLTLARGQLDLIENSFQLIGDQIVTMESPQELSGQLNELLDGVESIRQTVVETESMLAPLAAEDVTR